METTISSGGTKKFGKVRGGGKRKRERFIARVQSLLPPRVRSSEDGSRDYRGS